MSKTILGLLLLLAATLVPPTVRAQVPVVSSGLGGLYNVGLEVLDAARFREEFGSDTIDVQFLPVDLYPNSARMSSYDHLIHYVSEVVVTSRRLGAELMRFFVNYTVDGEYHFTDRSSASSVRSYHGSFHAATSEPVEGTVGVYDGMFGVRFDFNFLQGDTLRFGGGPMGDTIERRTASDLVVVPAWQFLGSGAPGTGEWLQAMPSYGRVKLDVEALPCDGCRETITFSKQGRTYTFPDVPYMTLRVRNVDTFVRELRLGTTTERDTVRYDYLYPLDPWLAVMADTAKTSGTITRLVDVGNHGLLSYGWLDLDETMLSQRRSPIQRARFTATAPVRPIGTPGRYYVGTATGTDDQGGTHVVRFSHALHANGAQILLDFSGMAGPDPALTLERAAWIPEELPIRDLAPGDRLVVHFTGGTQGLPEPGVTIPIVASSAARIPVQTGDAGAFRVDVSPNPAGRELGFRFSLDAPEHVRIAVYTADGSLVGTILDQRRAAGSQTVFWRNEGLAAGAYLYEVRAGDRTATGVLHVR
jgi:hypothetical protein